MIKRTLTMFFSFFFIILSGLSYVAVNSDIANGKTVPLNGSVIDIIEKNINPDSGNTANARRDAIQGGEVTRIINDDVVYRNITRRTTDTTPDTRLPDEILPVPPNIITDDKSAARIISGNGMVTNIWFDRRSQLDMMRRHNIYYLFVDVGGTTRDGMLTSPDEEIDSFLDFIEQYEMEENYDFRLLAYSEINTEETYDLSPEFISNYVMEYTRLSNNGFDGLLVDIEPVKFEDRTVFLDILDELRDSMPSDSIISVYSGGFVQSGTDNEWEWDRDFFMQVSRRADIISVPGYDTDFTNEADYKAYLRKQIEDISDSNFKSRFLFAVPTHNSYPETLEVSLSAYNMELPRHPESPFMGITIFSEWTIRDNDWNTLERYKILQDR